MLTTLRYGSLFVLTIVLFLSLTSVAFAAAEEEEGTCEEWVDLICEICGEDSDICKETAAKVDSEPPPAEECAAQVEMLSETSMKLEELSGDALKSAKEGVCGGAEE